MTGEKKKNALGRERRVRWPGQTEGAQPGVPRRAGGGERAADLHAIPSRLARRRRAVPALLLARGELRAADAARAIQRFRLACPSKT